MTGIRFRFRKRKEEIMNPMIEKYLGSVLRSALAAGLGALGILSEAEIEKQAAALAGLILVTGWSLWEKYHSRKKLVTAMASGPTSEVAVKAAIAAGIAPPVATAKHDVPELSSVPVS